LPQSVFASGAFDSVFGLTKIRGSTAPKQKIVWSAKLLCITDETTLGAADSDLVGYCLIIALPVDVDLAKRARSPVVGNLGMHLTSAYPVLNGAIWSLAGRGCGG
jgi:hypothetical protein